MPSVPLWRLTVSSRWNGLGPPQSYACPFSAPRPSAGTGPSSHTGTPPAPRTCQARCMLGTAVRPSLLRADLGPHPTPQMLMLKFEPRDLRVRPYLEKKPLKRR